MLDVASLVDDWRHHETRRFLLSSWIELLVELLVPASLLVQPPSSRERPSSAPPSLVVLDEPPSSRERPSSEPSSLVVLDEPPESTMFAGSLCQHPPYQHPPDYRSSLVVLDELPELMMFAGSPYQHPPCYRSSLVVLDEYPSSFVALCECPLQPLCRLLLPVELFLGAAVFFVPGIVVEAPIAFKGIFNHIILWGLDDKFLTSLTNNT